jgi:hypothetical protein
VSTRLALFHSRPSYSAKAEYPVRRSLSIDHQRLEYWSPVEPGDDSLGLCSLIAELAA